MTSYENILPTELWVQVMKYVPPKDLCSVVLTSQYMNTLASTQELWTGTKINKQKVMRDGLIHVFNINRFKKIKSIDLSSMGVWVTSERKQNLLKKIPRTPLEEVDIRHNIMAGIPADVLAQEVSHLKAVDLLYTHLKTIQSIKVLEASISENSLQKVKLAGVYLGGVPASQLVRAVSRLQTVDLANTSLTEQQSTAILEVSLSSATLT